jgi:hypothetical protein
MREKILSQIKNIISEIESNKSQLLNHQGVTTANLDLVVKTLNKYMEEILADSMPAKENRRSILGRVISDSWDYSLSLSERILEVEDRYRQL